MILALFCKPSELQVKCRTNKRMISSDDRVYLLCSVVSPVFFALVSHCNLRIDSHTHVQLPPHFMVDFGYVAVQILRNLGKYDFDWSLRKEKS
jgi:hypothetical protein